MCIFIAVCLLLLSRINILEATGSSITSVRNVSIECKSERYGVVFKFQEQKSYDYIRLAECQFGPGGHSQLMAETFKGTYDVTHVNYTCVLTILYLTVDQCGIYTCSEMYNESETVEKQIGWNCEGTPRSTETTESHCTPIIVVLSVVCVVLAGSNIAFIVHFLLRRKKNQHTSDGNRQTLEDISEAASLIVPQSEVGDEETSPNNDAVDAVLVSSNNLNVAFNNTLTGDITKEDEPMSSKCRSAQNNIEQESPGLKPEQDKHVIPTNFVNQKLTENTPMLLEELNAEHRLGRLNLDDTGTESPDDRPVEEQEKQTTPTKTVGQIIELFDKDKATKSTTQYVKKTEVPECAHQAEQSKLVSNTNQAHRKKLEEIVKPKSA